MLTRPIHLNAFEFAVLASRRVHQLMNGCAPHIAGTYKATTMAQMEVAAGKVWRVAAPVVAAAVAAPVDAHISAVVTAIAGAELANGERLDPVLTVT
jgi:RNA polymerase Rpb6